MRRLRLTRGGRLRRAATSACLTGVLCAFAAGGVARAADPVATALPAAPGSEAEPNESLANASEIASGERVRGSVFPAGDVDRYRFTAAAGDLVFATVMTNGSAGNSADTQLRLLRPDGTEIEFDDDEGSLGSLSSSIAGATIPAAGTYYLDVRAFESNQTVRPYDLLLDVRSGAPAAEAEPNDSPAGANPLGGGFVAGARAAADEDWYALELDAGDTVFLSLDLDPERDGTTFNGRLVFGSTTDLLQVDDPGTGDSIDSEAYVATVREAGTYSVLVDAVNAAATGTYQLSATVIPAVERSCRSYAVTPSPGTIPDQGVLTLPIDVADAATIDHVAVVLDVTHARMGELDVTLQAPTGNQVSLVTDIGSEVPGSPRRMQVLFDDDAGSAPHSAALSWPSLQPEPAARLSYFSGQPAAGTWNLRLYDDLPNLVGTLSRAELILCARPQEGPEETVFSAGFESGDDGFTHSGSADEWERGLPATPQQSPSPPANQNNIVAGLASCAVGTKCFKTDLDSTYELNSSQDLVSPPISLAGRTGTVYASWAMWYQLESASFDHATVSVEEDGGGDRRPLFTWLGASMSQVVGGGGSAQVVPFAAGWGVHRADISAYAGRTIRLRFHLDSDDTVRYAGLAIDDVRVTQPMFALAVAIAGSGSGFVDSSPAGIDCGTNTVGHPTCSVTRSGSVTLTAHPDADSSFAGFSGGGCSGAAATCTVPLDQARSVTAAFELLPQAPIANGDHYATQEDAPLNVDAPGVLGNDSDGNGDTLTATPASGPAHGELALRDDGSFTYTPDPGFSGRDSFAYRARDGALESDPATVTIDVAAKPVFPLDVAITGSGSGSVDSSPAGIDCGTNTVGHPTCSVTRSGSVTLTAHPDADSSFAGFTGGGCSGAAATCTVSLDQARSVTATFERLPRAPTADGDQYATNEDTPLSVDAPGVLGNDSDRDGDTLTATPASGPAHGELALRDDGSFTYTPDRDFNGRDSFTYRAGDGALESDPATATIDVAPVDDPPPPQPPPPSQPSASSPPASTSPPAPASVPEPAVLRLRAPGLSVFARTGSKARCRMRSGRLRSCRVRLVRGARVLAVGHARRPAGVRNLTVRLHLTKRGRALLAERVGGVHARLRARALTSGGTREASKRTRALLQVERFTTPPGSWVPGAASLSDSGERFLRGLRGRLVAAAGLRCDGHSARARAPAVAHEPVSLARAALLCHALARFAGGSVRPTVVGHGTAEPIARNDTESGRDENRRVVVTVTHRPRRLP